MGTNSSGRTNIFEKYAESIQQPFSMPFYRWKRCKNMGSYRVSQSLYPINGIIIIWGKVFIHSQYDILTDHMIAIWNTRNIYRIENPNWSRASYNIYLYKIWWYENYSYAIRISIPNSKRKSVSVVWFGLVVAKSQPSGCKIVSVRLLTLRDRPHPVQKSSFATWDETSRT
jgi:hypothetical protein